MKVVLALAVLCGLILTCESACNIAACTLSGATCTGYTNQLTCYNTEKDGCTSGQTAEITLLDAGISSVTTLKNTACGAGSGCNIAACTLSGATCTGYTNQLTCYNTEKDGCTSGQTALIAALDGAISSVTILKNTACGAGSITQASLPVMILSLVAVYFKLK